MATKKQKSPMDVDKERRMAWRKYFSEQAKCDVLREELREERIKRYTLLSFIIETTKNLDNESKEYILTELDDLRQNTPCPCRDKDKVGTSVVLKCGDFMCLKCLKKGYRCPFCKTEKPERVI